MQLFSRSQAVTYIGSDEGEIFEGDAIRTSFAAFTSDHVKRVPENLEVKGYEAGTFGWPTRH
ncbi:MAG: hypothetical protein AAF727_14820 [Pseudomonadota bacterium]